MNRIVLDYRYWAIPVLIWTFVAIASYAWNRRELERHAFELATNRAVFVFKMMESVRLWNARHGGVYAPIDANTPPNPYLKVPERDIVTPSGKALTLINPAYMTRQLTEVVRDYTGMKVHLTSLKPINPHNAADPWEQEQLRSFEHGTGQVTELTGSGAQAEYRFMAPLLTEKPCLKCHEKQGYKLGDIRGGVSISFAAAPLLAADEAQRVALVRWHVVAWLLLSALTLFALSRQRRHVLALQAAKAQQDALVEQRTAELRAEVDERRQTEAQLRLFIDSSGEGIYAVDSAGICTLVNPEALRMFGMERPEQLLGHSAHQLIHHSYADGAEHPVAECSLHRTLNEGQPAHADDDVFWRLDGRPFPVEYRARPLFAEGQLIGAVVTFNDISERKRYESALRKLSGAVEHSPAAAIITDVDGRIEYVNPRFTEMTGYRPEEVLGMNPRMWQSGRTPLRTYQRLWETIKSGHVWHGEVLNKTKDGRLFWEDSQISPIKNEQGLITHFVAVKEDITARKELEEQIWYQAHHDGLTGLPNRELFQARLEQALTLADQNDGIAALLYLDLDGFKQVNDRFGHHAGDTVLKEAAQRLAAAVRDTDTAARLGGDEFAVILAQLQEPASAAVVAAKVAAQMRRPFVIEGDEVTLSGSVGIALYPQHGTTTMALLQNADAAMYRAKQEGRDRYAFFAEPE